MEHMDSIDNFLKLTLLVGSVAHKPSMLIHIYSLLYHSVSDAGNQNLRVIFGLHSKFNVSQGQIMLPKQVKLAFLFIKCNKLKPTCIVATMSLGLC